MSKRKRDDEIISFYNEKELFPNTKRKKYNKKYNQKIDKVESSKEEYLRFYIDKELTLEEKEAKERKLKRIKKEDEFIKKKTKMCLIKCIQKLDIDSGLKINRYNMYNDGDPSKTNNTCYKSFMFIVPFTKSLWLSNEDYMSVELTDKGKKGFIDEIIKTSGSIINHLTSKCSLFYNISEILVVKKEESKILILLKESKNTPRTIVKVIITFQPNGLFRVIPDIPKMLKINTATRYSILSNELRLIYNCEQKYEDVSKCEVFLDYLFIVRHYNFVQLIIKFLTLIRHKKIGFILENVNNVNNINNNSYYDLFDSFKSKRYIKRIKSKHVVIFDEGNFKKLLEEGEEEKITLDFIDKFRFLETIKNSNHYLRMRSFMDIIFNHINDVKDSVTIKNYKCLTTLNEKIKMIGKFEKIK